MTAMAAAATPCPLEPLDNEIPPDWPNRSLSGFLTTERHRWHLQRSGSGEPLLLLHGTAASTHTWRDLMPALAAHFDVMALDLPGHGYSRRLTSAPLTLDNISADIAELMRMLEFSPRHIVGHSAGAAIAIDMAVRRRLAPRSIVGLNAALLPFGGVMHHVFAPMARFFANTALMPNLLARRARDPAAVARVLRSTGSLLDEEGRRYYQDLFRREAHIASVLEMMASWDLSALVDELPELDARLLLLVGTRDRAVNPIEASKVAGVCRHAEVRRIGELGHLAHEEQPGEVAAIIRDFIRLGPADGRSQ